MLWTTNNHYISAPFELEADLEAAIQEVKGQLFGKSRIYLEVKKMIGKKGVQQNIPDAYILDLSSLKSPKLFVVENELSSHDPLRHIAVQILQFSLAFETNPQRVKEILRSALKANHEAELTAKNYAIANGFESVDYLLDQIIHKKEAFNALVIIDEANDDLATILKEKFRFPVELLTLERFCSDTGEIAYKFDSLLNDVDSSDVGTQMATLDPAELDTIVVPAQEDGFNETFLGENRWYKIRMSAAMIPQIKYCAAYRVAPTSAITHYAKVADIIPYKDTGKYEVVFEGPAEKLKKTIKLVQKSTVKALLSPRYTSFKRMLNASNLNEAF
jgi:hypothetical protein